MSKSPFPPMALKTLVVAAIVYGLLEWLALMRSRWADRGRARQRPVTGS